MECIAGKEGEAIMRRKRNAGAPPPVAPQPRPHIVTQERAYTLITPLFGGGAVTGERDEVTIIRGTEIRGHLRFWWRACYGGRYSSVAEMKQDEDRIWGAASTSKKDENAGAEQQSTSDVKNSQETTVQVRVDPLNCENILVLLL